jgi:hypothetical protein
MTGIVNLNKARKERARAQKRARSEENAVRFGRSKAQIQRDRAEKEKARRDLDGHRRET